MKTIEAPMAGTAPATPQRKFSEEEEIRLMDYPDSTEEIPLLDMSPYLRGEPGGRERVAARLKEISETVGFFYLAGHGIPQSLIERVFAESRRFHGLPSGVKGAIPWIDRDSHKTGYLGVGQERSERTNVNIISDAKSLYARFTIIREPDPRVETNVWPENLPGFKSVVLEYQAAVEALGKKFLPLWSTALELPLDFFDRMFEIPHVTLSLLHYPPQKAIGGRQYGIAPHTDNSMMTFLAQANIPGLAVRMPSGSLAARRHHPRNAAREYGQRHRALDQRPVPVDQAPGDQHQLGGSLFDSRLLRSERRRGDRGGADLPRRAESTAVRTDHLSRFPQVVLRRVIPVQAVSATRSLCSSFRRSRSR
jgi:isopenicillin N synthase-like dioxygenase